MNLKNIPYYKPIGIGLLIIGLLFGIILFFSSFYTIQEGHKGVVLKFNKLSSVEDPGLNFKVPFMTKVVEVDTRTENNSVKVVAGTNDLQNVSTTVAVNYHLNSNAVGEIYSKIGLANIEPVISKRIIETTTAVVAKYKAEDLLKQRELVKNQIVAQLNKTLTPYHITIEDVQITEFRFSDAYSKSIEAKQIAEQAALTAINKTRTVKEEATQAIEKAKGEAEAIRIQSEAIKQNGGKEYIELKAIEAWDGKLPNTMLSGATPFINVK